MPRRPRIHLNDVPLHIVQRGHNREPCFFAEEDYHAYLHWLKQGTDHGFLQQCQIAISPRALESAVMQFCIYLDAQLATADKPPASPWR